VNKLLTHLCRITPTDYLGGTLHLKTAAFGNVMQCSLIEVYRHFRGTAASIAWVVVTGRLQQNASTLPPGYTLLHHRQQAVFTANAMKTSNPKLLPSYFLQLLFLQALEMTECSSLCHVKHTSLIIIIIINDRVTMQNVIFPILFI
jgi:hypothetical protein